ncbi:heterokaryon incompatibility protein-domain-containing protein [Halenospora varia]|nr:heterokaryon incompatibility protein-domain-containing protein [Halenospora varia]
MPPRPRINPELQSLLDVLGIKAANLPLATYRNLQEALFGSRGEGVALSNATNANLRERIKNIQNPAIQIKGLLDRLSLLPLYINEAEPGKSKALEFSERHHEALASQRLSSLVAIDKQNKSSLISALMESEFGEHANSTDIFNTKKLPWTVTEHPLSELKALPKKIDHPGVFEYIGTKNNGSPKWLWDSKTDKTMATTDSMLREGYIAISYTWGRFRLSGQWRTEPGVPWRMPALRPNGQLDISNLKRVLCQLPNARYFWIDVYCIDQENKEEKAREIDKQGAIFENAKGVLAWLWTIDDAKEFSEAMQELGSALRWYFTQYPTSDSRSKMKSPSELVLVDEFGKKLREDPWFSSLWCLQEKVLAPATIWIARDGSFCRINKEFATTHFIAQAMSLVLAREALYEDNVQDDGLLTLDPTANHVLHGCNPHWDDWTIFDKWRGWTFQKASIITCLAASRINILLAASKRTAIEARGLACLAALKIGYNKKYEDDRNDKDPFNSTGGLPVTLLQDVMRAEGGNFFDCVHQEDHLTGILPTTASFVLNSLTLSLSCGDWRIERDSFTTDVIIPQDTMIQQPLQEHGNTRLWLTNTSSDWSGATERPEDDIRAAVKQRGYKNVAILFIPLSISLNGLGKKNGYLTSRGMVLVSFDEHIIPERWHKAGMYYAKRTTHQRLSKSISVRGQ